MSLKKHNWVRIAMPQVFFVLHLLLPFGSQAQHVHRKQGLPEMAREAHHVLEAKVVEQTCYWSDDHTKIFTKSILEVYKNFKGDLKTNRLELNRIGGQLDGTFQEVSDVPNLYKGQFGIFFIGKYEHYLYLNEEPITYHQDGVNETASGAFMTMKNIAYEVYQPLQEACGQSPQKVSSNPFEQQFTERLRRRGITAQQPLEMGIEFSFENATLSFSNGVFLEFDIFSKELVPTLSKFAKSNLYFQYNSALFGTNIAANNLLQLGKGTILNNPNYTLQVVDDAPDRVKIVVDKLTDNDLYLLSTTAEQLVRAKINISQLSQSPDIIFDEGAMQGESFFYNAATQQQMAYPYVFANDAIRQEILAKPIITGFSPRQLRAGTNDTLTITGANFGTAKGKIWFPNSDTAYIKYVEVGDTIDIISWTNTSIKTLVPSAGTIGRTVAGSGLFIVQAASSVLDTTKSSDYLEIIYAIQNDRSALTNTSFRINLVDTNQQGGLTFRYHPNFRSRTNAVTCFNEALKKWRCATGVNFVIGRDTNSSTVGIDGVNLIKFASPADFATLGVSPTTLALTFVTYYYRCADANSGILYGHTSEIDMFFKDETNLWYIDTASTATIPVDRVDFYSICLHEQGHAHRLKHVVESNKVMVWALAPQVRKRNLNTADIAGGINVVDYSIVQRPPYNATICKPLPMQRVVGSACNTVTNVSEMHQQNEFQIKNHPNPTSDYQMVTFDLPTRRSVGLFVYNLVGDLLIEQQPVQYDAGNHTIGLNCFDLPDGIYILQVAIGTNRYSTKFVKSY